MIFSLLSWLGLVPTFQKTKCKKLLSTTMERIKLLRSRREAQLRQLRIDLAKLLQLGKEEKAQAWIGLICQELCLLSLYRKISAYCESVQDNIKDIAGQEECPTNLEEPVAGLCFAASCFADLPELQVLREMFAMKYGRKFVTSAQDLEPDCHINREFLECLYAKDPPDRLKQELLEKIIAQYKLKQGNGKVLHRHEPDLELMLEAHEWPIQRTDVGDLTELVVKAKSVKEYVQDTSSMQEQTAVSTVREDDLGTTEVLAKRRKASASRQTRHSAFKRAYNRRQSWQKEHEEGHSGSQDLKGKGQKAFAFSDDSNANMNAAHAEGTTAPMGDYEAPKMHGVLYVKQPSFSLPPQRPPPPPPPPRPSRGAQSPPPRFPPNRAPPPPPLRSNSMPSSRQIHHHENDNSEVPLPFRFSSSLATKQYNQSFDWNYVHPRLPKYEDLVANLTALKH